MVHAPIMEYVILLQDLAYVILVLKEVNVKVSLIKNILIFCFILTLHLELIGISCPGNGEGICNGNGQCDVTTGSCICNLGFEGTQCEG